MNVDNATVQIITETQRLAAQGRVSEAIFALEENTANMLSVLAMMYHDQGNVSKAENILQSGLKNVSPGNWRLYSNLAHVRSMSDNLPAAFSAAWRAANGCEGVTYEPYYNLAVILADLNRNNEAVAMYEEAIRIAPENWPCHYNMGTILLKQGKYSSGWDFYEKRFKTYEITKKFRDRFPQPDWSGKKEKKASVVVFNEQGLGDFIQFARFLPILKQRVGKVIVEVQESLKGILDSLKIDEIILRKDDASEFPVTPKTTYCASICSLPRMLNIHEESQIPNKPYIYAPKRKRHRGFDKKKLNVGLCWAGNPAHTKDNTRSIPLNMLRELDMEGVQLYSLQKFSGGIRRWPSGPIDLDAGRDEFPMTDLAKIINDYADLAYFSSHLDLVVTVDTGVAHLMGAMGIKTWLLIPADRCDWRWGEAGETTIWYPSITLFRQDSYGEWKNPITRIVNRLAALRTSQG